MATALAAASDTAAGAVAQVMLPLAEAVRVAVEVVSAASAAETSGAELRLSRQMDAGVATVKEHVESGLERVLASTAAVATELTTHVDARFSAVEVELGRFREVMAWLVTENLFPNLRARQLVREELSHAHTTPLSTSATARVVLSASETETLRAAPSPVRASKRLLKESDCVRSMQVSGRLADVHVFETAKECVPFLPMASDLTWQLALDEYAAG